MIRSFLIAFAAFGIFTVAAQVALADNPSGARWYPFYGYRQPAYLAQRTTVTAQPAAVTVQPTGARVYSTNYWPSETAVTAPAAGYSQSSTSAQWYPFYGYRRPAYLDR
jgi:hypothetical protein